MRVQRTKAKFVTAVDGRRRIRCLGTAGECQPCLNAGVTCTRTARLQRNRKRKSYYEAEDGVVPVDDVRDVQRQTQGSQASPSGSVPEGASLGSQSPGFPTVGSAASTKTPSSYAFSSHAVLESAGLGRHSDNHISPASQQSKRPSELPATRTTEEAIIRHMGRLVCDDRGVAMFAGSTTGVHFASQAEQHMQILHETPQMFPSSAYGLHLHDLGGHQSHRHGDTDLLRHLLSRLPPDADNLLYTAISRLTPIYPVVHESTTIRALGELRSWSRPMDTSAFATLHLILSLLAIGAIGRQGPCSRDHLHFTCLSEVYYGMSTSIHDRILEKPCLQTLQALEVSQIYLQLSSRKQVSSQLSGTATRLAQSLGLHRHSQRFRFDPLEAEVRRRSWWCQYALDTFSSTFHGLPRLIRDQDVDTDLPLSLNHTDMSLSSMAFPLPGEGSQVDSAIAMFQIARIMGSALENLYTTTHRRGGVSKIKQLQAELDVWTKKTSNALTTVPNKPKGTYSETDLSFEPTTAHELEPPLEAIWLQLVLSITTIHVHRPALSFTSPEPQVADSLKRCIHASRILISIIAKALMPAEGMQALQKNPEKLFLVMLNPSGPHLLWQAGLHIMYAHWKSRQASTLDGVLASAVGNSAAEADSATVAQCVAALCRLESLTMTHGTISKPGRLTECADVLERLREKTFGASDLAGTGSINAAQHTIPMNGGASMWDSAPWNGISLGNGDWPIESVLDFANSMDVEAMDLLSASPLFPSQ